MTSMDDALLTCLFQFQHVKQSRRRVLLNRREESLTRTFMQGFGTGTVRRKEVPVTGVEPAGPAVPGQAAHAASPECWPLVSTTMVPLASVSSWSLLPSIKPLFLVTIIKHLLWIVTTDCPKLPVHHVSWKLTPHLFGWKSQAFPLVSHPTCPASSLFM